MKNGNQNIKRQARLLRVSPWFFLLWFFAFGIAPGIDIAWAQQTFTTQRTVVYYDKVSSLQEMERRLRFRPVDYLNQKYFYTQDSAQTALASGLSPKIENLLTKVCQILNIWLRKPGILKIYLLENSEQVRQSFLAMHPFLSDRSIFGHRYAPEAVEGFYVSHSRSIFLSLADLTEGVLAHEMAHFVLCEFSARPPSKEIQENWAHYVEDHLD